MEKETVYCERYRATVGAGFCGTNEACRGCSRCPGGGPNYDFKQAFKMGVPQYSMPSRRTPGKIGMGGWNG